jgi:hypothetical protein
MTEVALSVVIHERRLLSRGYPSNILIIDFDLFGY